MTATTDRARELKREADTDADIVNPWQWLTTLRPRPKSQTVKRRRIEEPRQLPAECTHRGCRAYALTGRSVCYRHRVYVQP